MAKLAQNRRGAIRPILREPDGTDHIEQRKVAAVVRNAVRRGLGQRQGSNPLGNALAGRKSSGGGSIRGGTFTGPAN